MRLKSLPCYGPGVVTWKERGPESVTRMAPLGRPGAFIRTDHHSGGPQAATAASAQQHSLPELTCKATCPLWDATTGTFVGAEELRIGDKVETETSVFLGITTLNAYWEELTAYNLQIDTIRAYYAGTSSVLVHNSFGQAPPNLRFDRAGRSGAFRQAKSDVGIPRSQQPSSVGANLARNGSIQPGRTYYFDTPEGQVGIREDSGGHFYGPKDLQNRGPHFNTPDGGHYEGYAKPSSTQDPLRHNRTQGMITFAVSGVSHNPL